MQKLAIIFTDYTQCVLCLHAWKIQLKSYYPLEWVGFVLHSNLFVSQKSKQKCLRPYSGAPEAIHHVRSCWVGTRILKRAPKPFPLFTSHASLYLYVISPHISRSFFTLHQGDRSGKCSKNFRSAFRPFEARGAIESVGYDTKMNHRLVGSRAYT